MPLKRLVFAILLTLGLTAMGWARKPGEPLKPGFNLFSRQQDIQLGQISAAQVKTQYEEVRNPFLQDYIRRIGERLAATREARQSAFPFSFTMLNVPLVNAFALPGGPMFIFTGLIKATDNEAQLAGVMAHELSHVILRHGTHEASKAKATGLGAMLAGALAGAALGNASTAAQLANAGLGLGQNSLILHFSREAESEADALGSHLMAEASYNPLEMARFFEKLEQTGSYGSQFFSDHPNPGNRERAIEAELRALPPREYGFETHDFERAKAEVNALPPAGQRPAAAALASGAAPSEAWKQITLQRYRVAFPANWAVYKGSDGNALIIAPAGGLDRGANGKADLIIGVSTGYFRPDSAQMSLGTATLNLVSHLHDQDASMMLASPDQKRVQVDGSEGLILPLQSKSPSAGDQINLLLTVGRPEGLFYALTATPQRNFPQLRRTFEQILSSIHFEGATSGTPENRQNK